MIRLDFCCFLLSLIFIGHAKECDNSTSGRQSCQSNGTEYSRKSSCESAGCCWDATYNGIPNCFQPKANSSSNTTATNNTMTVTYSYTICINCDSNSSREKRVNESLDTIKDIFGGKSVNGTKSELKKAIASAFNGTSSVESIGVMDRFLRAAPDLYETSSGEKGVDLWLNFFDTLIEYPAAKMESNPENFLNVSSEIFINAMSSTSVNTVLAHTLIARLEKYAVIMTKPLLGNVNQTNTRSTNLNFNDVSFGSCFESANLTGCELKNQFVSGTVTSPYVRAYVTSVTYNSKLDLRLLEGGVFQRSRARIGSSLFSVVSHDGEEGVHNTSIAIRFSNKDLVTGETPICAFISSGGDWSTRGCRVIDTDALSTSCACNHNTSFALLFLHADIEVTEEEKLHFEIITYIGSGTSISALMLTVFCFFYLKLTNIKRVLLHINLSTTLCLGQIVLLIGTSMDVGTAQCKVVAVLLHFFFMSSFSWMLMEGILLYFQSVRAVKGEVNFKLMLAFGWILPITIVGISLAVGFEGYGSDRGCWLSIHNGLTWAFIGPAMGFILINTILLGLIVKVFLKLKSNAKGGEWERTKRGMRAIVLLTPLLGITWIFGALAIDESTKWFLYLFSICNSLQGLAIFFFHCIHNYDVRKAFLKKYRHSFQNIPPFFSSISPTATGKTFVKSTSASVSTPTTTHKNWNQ